MVACARCGGLLVRERLFEANGMSSTERVDCERCLNCGALEDTVIRTNRYAARSSNRSREPRGPRIHYVGSTALMGHSAHLNYTGACPELEAHQFYGPAARTDHRRCDHTHGQHRGCDEGEHME